MKTEDKQIQGETPSTNWLFQITEAILSFLQSMNLYLVVTFMVCTVLFYYAADKLFQSSPPLITKSYDGIAKEVANRLPAKSGQNEILQTIHQYNLSWLYITRQNGSVLPNTLAYTPDIKNYGYKKSRSLSWQGSKYYEAVAPINKDELLHLGFSTNSTIPNITSYQSLLDIPYFALPLNFGLLLFVLIGILLSLLIILSYAVADPLKQLAQACSSLFLARDAYSAVIRGGLKVPVLTVSEVKRMAAGLMDVRRQYDGQFFARAKKEEELQQQRSTHATAELEMSEQFKEEIASARQSLTELQAKESDEEFLASLVHVTDTLSSRRQICQKILDRLNDKYPTSIMHAAFLMFDDKSLIIESSIGLDDRALQTLKRVDNMSLAEELFRLGSSLELGLQTLRERGLQELALQLSLKKAVYLPISYQKKNLGMLAVYFPIQGQTVNDRIRLLRRVVEPTSRQLYQMSLYLEELEASRTDPLTGFRNRKYFHEIIPQVIERASIDPENLKFSVIMIDADHFKKINDGFGHQIGDEVLRVISSTIESSIRLEDRGNRPMDYLIRFGGEEFLVILEKTDASVAEKVAERIRSTMDNKVD